MARFRQIGTEWVYRQPQRKIAAVAAGLSSGEVLSGAYAFDTWQWDTTDSPPDTINWYLIHQLMDSEAEAMNKVIRALRVTGKFTGGRLRIHGAAPGDDIDKDEIEDGIGALSTFTLANSTEITRYSRIKCKVKNMSLWAVRLSGAWPGTGIKDRLDELSCEGDVHGGAK